MMGMVGEMMEMARNLKAVEALGTTMTRMAELATVMVMEMLAMMTPTRTSTYPATVTEVAMQVKSKVQRVCLFGLSLLLHLLLVLLQLH